MYMLYYAHTLKVLSASRRGNKIYARVEISI